MNVFEIKSTSDPTLQPMICKSIKQMYDFEATVGMFLCLPEEEEWCKPGMSVTITLIEMSEEEFAALPEHEWS